MQGLAFCRNVRKGAGTGSNQRILRAFQFFSPFFGIWGGVQVPKCLNVVFLIIIKIIKLKMQMNTKKTSRHFIRHIQALKAT